MHEKLNYQEHSWKVKTNSWVNLNQFPLFERTTLRESYWLTLPSFMLTLFPFPWRFGIDSLESSSSHVTFPLPTILPSQPFSHPFIKVTIHVTTPIFLVIDECRLPNLNKIEEMNIKLYKLNILNFLILIYQFRVKFISRITNYQSKMSSVILNSVKV
jgi:hypothetical protein